MTDVTITLGPLGGVFRDELRSLAFKNGVAYNETRKLLTSTFDLKGPTVVVRKVIDAMRAMVDRTEKLEKQERHRRFVDRMEADEKSRLRWGRLIGRKRRFEPLSRVESQAVLDILVETARGAKATKSAEDRLIDGIKSARLHLAIEDLDDEVLSTLVAVRMRYLQQDVRIGRLEVAKPLRRRILAMRMPMDTWDD
jgi:hypothetical protein